MFIQCSTVKRKGKDGRNRKLGDAYAGAGSAVLDGYLRQSGLDGILREQLGRVNGSLVEEMISLQALRPASKNAYAASRKQTLGYLLGGKRDVSPDSFYRALDELADSFDGIRRSLNGRPRTAV